LGRLDAKGSPDDGSAKSHAVEFSGSLRAGSFTKVPVVIEGTPPIDVGFIRLRNITHTGISLSASQ